MKGTMSFFDRLRSLLKGRSRNGHASDGAGDMEMISCRDALILVHEYLDGELDDVPEARVKAHFDMCEQCYPHLHLEAVCRDALRRAAGRAVAPPGLKEKLVVLIAEAEAED